jgi:hypothetical protein
LYLRADDEHLELFGVNDGAMADALRGQFEERLEFARDTVDTGCGGSARNGVSHDYPLVGDPLVISNFAEG